MIHLTDEEYDNLLRQIDEKTECIALYAKERNEQRLRADRAEKRWSELKESIMHMPCNQVGQISPRYIFDKIKQFEEDGE